LWANSGVGTNIDVILGAYQTKRSCYLLCHGAHVQFPCKGSDRSFRFDQTI
jgi:hypothetical protein